MAVSAWALWSLAWICGQAPPEDTTTSSLALTSSVPVAAPATGDVRRDLRKTEEARADAERDEAAASMDAKVAAAARADAERARVEALKKAPNERSALLQQLRAAQARVADLTANLATIRQGLAEQREEASARRARASERAERLVAQVSTSTSADELLSQIDYEWHQALLGLERAIARTRTLPDLPRLDPPLDLPATQGSTVARTLAADIGQSLAETDASRDAIQAEAEAARFAALRIWYRLAVALGNARSRVWTSVSEEAKDARWELEAVLDATGWESVALRSEVYAWGALRLRELSRELPNTSPRELLRIGWPYLRSILILFGFWVGLALVDRGRARLRALMRGLRSLTWLRRLDNIDSLAEDFGRPVAAVVAVETVRATLPASSVEYPELMWALLIARWLSVFWLVRTALTRAVLWLARRGRAYLPRAMRARIMNSVRLFTRALVYSGVVVQAIDLSLGKGILASLARGTVVFALLAVGLALLRQWRSSVATAYLRAFPEGRLARAVEASKDKTLGFFVVVAAFGAVAARTVTGLAKDALLEVEQIRRALAYLFRLRLQRRQEQATEDIDAQTLPQGVRRACTIRPLKSYRLRVDRFPHLEEVRTRLARWSEHGEGCSVLLYGPKGSGKTTWLYKFLEEVEHEVEWVRPNEDGSLQALMRGEPSEPLLDPRLFVLDDLNRFLVRAPRGLDPYHRLTQWFESHGRGHFLIATCQELFSRYLRAAAPDRIPFRLERRLERWSEEDIKLMLMARAAGSGTVHEFDDLVVEEGQHSQEAVARSGEAYVRLLWDHSDGSPAVALHHWVESLVPTGDKRVRVRLFRSESTERLQTLSQDSRLLLAALLVHDGLTADEAAQVMRWPKAKCQGLMSAAADAEVLVQGSDERHRSAIDWERPLERHLRRQQLV